MKPRRSAFTLIEVLATLVLLGIVLPVAFRGISLALACAGNARRTSEATSLAETKLNDIISTGLSSSGGTAGDFGPDHPGFQWSYQTSTSGNYGMTEVDLTVTWLERGQPRSLLVSTLYYPTDSTSTATAGVTQ